MCNRLSRNPIYSHLVLLLTIVIAMTGCMQETMRYSELQNEISDLQRQLRDVNKRYADLRRVHDAENAEAVFRTHLWARLARLHENMKSPSGPEETGAHRADLLRTARPAELAAQIRESLVGELFDGELAKVIPPELQKSPEWQRAMNATVGQFHREVLPVWRAQVEEPVDLSVFARVRDHLLQLNISDNERDKQTRRDEAVAAVEALILQAGVVLELSQSLKEQGDQYYGAVGSIMDSLDSLADEPTEAEREGLAKTVSERLRSILPSASPTADSFPRPVASTTIEKLVTQLVVLRHRYETALERIAAVAQDNPSDSFLVLVIQPDEDPSAAHGNLSHNIGKVVINAQRAICYVAGAGIIALAAISAPVWAIVVVVLAALTALVLITKWGIDKMAESGGDSDPISGPDIEPPPITIAGIDELESPFPFPDDAASVDGLPSPGGSETQQLPGVNGDTKVTWRQMPGEHNVIQFRISPSDPHSDHPVIELILDRSRYPFDWLDESSPEVRVDSIEFPDARLGRPILMRLSRAQSEPDKPNRDRIQLRWDEKDVLEIAYLPPD